MPITRVRVNATMAFMGKAGKAGKEPGARSQELGDQKALLLVHRALGGQIVRPNLLSTVRYGTNRRTKTSRRSNQCSRLLTPGSWLLSPSYRDRRLDRRVRIVPA